MYNIGVDQSFYIRGLGISELGQKLRRPGKLGNFIIYFNDNNLLWVNEQSDNSRCFH